MSFLPSKVLNVKIQDSVTATASWPYDDGTGMDEWFTNNHPYQWSMTLSVTPQNHSSHLSRQPYIYTGLDINVGDWISTVLGKTYKIIEITSKTDGIIECTVEDVDRLNTLNDPNASGEGTPIAGNAMAFELSIEGKPKLDSISDYNIFSDSIIFQITSKFDIHNPLLRYRVEQPHTFDLGDQLLINPSTGDWELATTQRLYDHNTVVIGTVVDVSNGNNTFVISPNNRIENKIFPALPGNPGDLIYVDNDNAGEFVLEGGVESNILQPLYVKLTNTIISSVIGTETFDPTLYTVNDMATLPASLVINGITASWTNPGDMNLQGVLDTINALEPQTGVIAVTTGTGVNTSIQLQNNSGQGIILYEPDQVQPVLSFFGLHSVDNGIPAKGMIIEAAERNKSSSYAVDTMTERNDLLVKNGDSVWVANRGDSKWSQYMRVGIGTGGADAQGYIELTNEVLFEPSFFDDAIGLSYDFSTGDGVFAIGTVPDGAIITDVFVEIITPFDSTTPTLHIGDVDDDDRLMVTIDNDLTDLVGTTFTSNPGYEYTSLSTINVTIDTDGATAGNISISIAFSTLQE